MTEPLQPPPAKSKRFMDIVPANQTAASPTSRPTISPKASQSDPMVAVKSDSLADQPQPVPPTSDPELPAQELMQQEYQEVARELPAGSAVDSNQVVSDDPAAVVVTHTPQKLKRSGLDKVLLIILAVIILVLVLDLLLDYGTLKISWIPHTHFWHEWRA